MEVACNQKIIIVDKSPADKNHKYSFHNTTPFIFVFSDKLIIVLFSFEKQKSAQPWLRTKNACPDCCDTIPANRSNNKLKRKCGKEHVFLQKKYMLSPRKANYLIVSQVYYIKYF